LPLAAALGADRPFRIAIVRACQKVVI